MTTINDHINSILALHFSGEKLTEEQEQELMDWVCQHKDEYQKIARVFQSTANSNRMNFNADEAWSKVESQLTDHRSKFYQFRNYLAYAACIAILVGVSVLFMKQHHDDRQLFSNTTTSLLTVMLPDSSIVTLYPQAKVSYIADANKAERRTELEGKAFFKVRPNAQRPFIVTNNATSIRVLGTSFLVDGVEQSSTGIFVREGVVQVSTTKDQVVLKADEQALSKGGNLSKSIIQHPESVFDNHIQLKTYNNAPLSQIIKDIEDEFNVKILADESIRSNRISTKLKFVNLEELLSEISYICNIDYKKLSNKKYELFKPF